MPSKPASTTASYPLPKRCLSSISSSADWQFRRLRRAEAELWTDSMTQDFEINRKKGLPEDRYIHVHAIADNKDAFERIYRLQTSTARILNRSLETLLRLRELDLLHPAEQNEPNLPSMGPGPLAPPASTAKPTKRTQFRPPISQPSTPSPQPQRRKRAPSSRESFPLRQFPLPLPSQALKLPAMPYSKKRFSPIPIRRRN
jgi:hypothetical protein